MPGSNVWTDEWDSLGGEPWQGGTRTLRLPRGRIIGASLMDLPPNSAGSPYHFHHGHEEILVVLRGRPLLRTPDGERQLDEGEVVHFARGPAGAHKLSNATQDSVRYLFMSNLASPDAVEYPDTQQLSVMALTNSQFGMPLWDMRELPGPGDD